MSTGPVAVTVSRLTPDSVVSSASPVTGLTATVQAERDRGDPCGRKQPKHAVNVCVRVKGHDGPHVGEVDGVLLQFH
jgi:hypothetical protein